MGNIIYYDGKAVIKESWITNPRGLTMDKTQKYQTEKISYCNFFFVTIFFAEGIYTCLSVRKKLLEFTMQHKTQF